MMYDEEEIQPMMMTSLG
jgi:hypothetical protein